MDLFKKVLHVAAAVIFWGYIFALLFIEGTYHPFMKKNADTATKTVVEKIEPARTQVRTQTRIQTPPAQTGISVYTSTDSVELRSQQLYFSGVAPKAVAIKSASGQCQRNIASYENQLKCKEVTFFTKGCYARYRIGNGHVSGFGPTEKKAQVKAKQKCDVMAEESPYSCVLDTNKCITDGSDNQGTRSWNYRAVGVAEPFTVGGESRRYIYSRPGSSQEEAKNRVAEQCLSASGKPCRSITTIDGDTCIAMAVSSKGGYSGKMGDKKDEDKLKAEARKICSLNDRDNCAVRFFCPE